MFRTHPSYPHPYIAREGWTIIAISILLTLIFFLLSWSWIGWFAALFTLFSLQFFRDPYRPVTGDTHSVVSAADGQVISIQECHDPYLDRQAIRVSVFMNVFNVHANKSPVDGHVRNRWYTPGQFLNAAIDKASEKNERCALWLTTHAQQEIVCVQIAGLIARRILCYPQVDSQLRRGERFGFIRFGSRVDLYLPLEAHIDVHLGQKVYAGSSLIAHFPRSESMV